MPPAERIIRAVAEAHLQRLLERATEINAEEKYVYRIAKLELFGSMLNPDMVTVGDIDVAYELEAKDTTRDGYRALAEEAWLRAPEGSQFWNWPEDEVLEQLRAGSEIISLQYAPNLEGRGWPSRVIFDDGVSPPEMTL